MPDDELSAADRAALRLLAVWCDDDIPGLLPGGDYGDECFDSGWLADAHGMTVFTQRGEAAIQAAVHGGLAQRSRAFTLLLACSDEVGAENEDQVCDDIAAGLLGADDSLTSVSLTDAGVAFVRAAL